MPRRRRPSRAPRYFLTVQVAQSLDVDDELQLKDEGDDDGDDDDDGGRRGSHQTGGEEEAGGVGPVAYEFTLEGIDLLDTVATLRHAIEDKFFIPLNHQLLCGPLPSWLPLGDDDTTLVSLGIVPGEARATHTHHTHTQRHTLRVPSSHPLDVFFAPLFVRSFSFSFIPSSSQPCQRHGTM